MITLNKELLIAATENQLENVNELHKFVHGDEETTVELGRQNPVLPGQVPDLPPIPVDSLRRLIDRTKGLLGLLVTAAETARDDAVSAQEAAHEESLAAGRWAEEAQEAARESEEILTEMKSRFGAATYLPAFDFGDPAAAADWQETLTDYAMSFFPGRDSVPNSTFVQNLWDTHEWVWNVELEMWTDNGPGAVQKATNTALGLVKGNADTPGMVSVDEHGEMEVNGWPPVRALTQAAFNALSPSAQTNGTFYMIYKEVANGGGVGGGNSLRLLKIMLNGQPYISGTSLPTPDTVMRRDANGRAQVEAPAADKDVVNLAHLNGRIPTFGAPRPQTAAGIGQVGNKDGIGQQSLPPGGTYFYIAIGYYAGNATAYGSTFYCGVAAGGSLVGIIAGNSNSTAVIYWRLT